MSNGSRIGPIEPEPVVTVPQINRWATVGKDFLLPLLGTALALGIWYSATVARIESALLKNGEQDTRLDTLASEVRANHDATITMQAQSEQRWISLQAQLSTMEQRQSERMNDLLNRMQRVTETMQAILMQRSSDRGPAGDK